MKLRHLSCGRDRDAELARFCVSARSSAGEWEYHLLLARGFKLIPDESHAKLTEQVAEIKRMLAVFVQKLKADS